MTPAPTFDIQQVQKVRKVALGVGLIGLLTLIGLTAAMSESGAWLHEKVEFFGMICIGLCIVGRAWCSLYIGGRKKAELVRNGPYSISRNPLYVFSFLGAFGAGAQTGSITVALLFAMLTYGVFRAVVNREEAWLSHAFGDAYGAYRRRTPRFLPNPSLWRDQEEVTFKPVFMLRTLADGLPFLLAIPLFEAVKHVQDWGWLPVLGELL